MFFHKDNYRKSYSQSGEDMIVNFVLESFGIRNPSYLDIGAHYPDLLSNTFFFYKRGSRGVCVEPDPELCKLFKKKRKHDVCLNVGVGPSDEMTAEFFVMSTRSLNTFSREEAERYQSYGNQKIDKIIEIPLLSINNIIAGYFAACPNFVSLDVEGLDLKILESFDFSKYRPQVFCIETLTYTEDKTEAKIPEISKIMGDKGYMAYADTYINTIFVDSNAWRDR